MHNKSKTLAYLGLLIMTSIVGLSLIFVKIGLKYVSVFDLLAHRFSIAFICILILKFFGFIKIPKAGIKEWCYILSVSIFYPILLFTFQALGMQHSTVANAGIIFALAPVFTLIAGSLFLKEKSTKLQKTGIIISVLGLVYIFYHEQKGGNQHNILGNILLLSAMLSSVAYLIIAKTLMRRYDSLSITAVMISIGAVVFNIVSLFQHYYNETLNTYFQVFKHTDFTYSVLYLGILSSVTSSFLSNNALKYIQASTVSVFNNLSPLISIVGGVFLLNEKLIYTQVIGGLAVISGVAIVLITMHLQSKR